MTDWDKAKCIGQTELFFDERPVYVESAKQICQGCPIKQDCLTWALEHRESYGVWGGQTYDELRITASLLGYKPASRQEEVQHGTRQGYDWHKRTNTPIKEDDTGIDICGCRTAARSEARLRMAKYRARLRSVSVSD